MSLSEGFYSIPAAEYHADPCPEISLSRSMGWTLIDRSPMHLQASDKRLGGTVERSVTAEMDFGTVVHRIVLGAGGEIVIGDFDDWRTKAARDFRDDARTSGQTPILLKDYSRADEAAKAIRTGLDEIGLQWAFRDGRSEETAIWREEATWLRCMFDSLILEQGSAVILDLKTTSIASPVKAQRKIFEMGYALQAAFYTRAVEVLRPDLAGRVRFLFVFAETTAPFAVCALELSEAGMDIGRSQFDRALATWRQCRETGRWPGYADDVLTITPPTWALYREEEMA